MDTSELTNIAETIEKIGATFNEYKSANDERLKQIEAKGVADPVTDAKMKKLDDELNGLTKLKAELEKLATRASRPGGGSDAASTPEMREYRAALNGWIRRSRDPESAGDLYRAGKALEARAAVGNDMERRAAQVITSTGSAGGFALPEEIAREIDRLSVDISPIRQIAKVVTVGSPDYKELIDVGGAAFEWVGENGTRSQTNTPDLAEVAPTFGMASARPRATEESLDDLFFNVESWLIESVAEAMAAGEGAAFVNGNGTNRPTGFLAGPTPVATADASRAFGTLQYTPSGGAAALPTSADVYYNLIYSLRARYRANARWVTSKAVLAELRKLKDTTNNYLWQPSLVAGQPEMLMGYPVTEAEDMPAVAANAFPIAFGDFQQGYLVADRVGLRITRDDITLPGFVQFYVRKRVGGRLRNTQAIKLLKCATS